MRRALGRFADLLRAEGLAVSAAELIDAGRALETTDVADRDALRGTLVATLAKRRGEIEIVGRAFDHFFAPPRLRRSRRKRKKKRSGGGDPMPGGVRDGEGRGVREAQPKTPAARWGRGLRRARREALETLLREAARRGDARRYPCAIVRTPGAARAEDRGEARARGIARKPFRSRFTAAESDALADAVLREIRRMRLRRVRRRRRARRGTIWVQRVVRSNLGHDGVPFRLFRHRPARREPHLLLLVDVSHSVERAAAAFLSLATHATRSFRSLRAYLFVDRAVEVTRSLSRLADLSGRVESLERVIAAHPDLNPYAPSDYGRVFFQLMEREVRRMRRDTIVVVLGDGRTNRFDPSAFALEALGARARCVVWLVPEPFEEWDTGDSAIVAYAPHVDVLAEAADLAGLVPALRRTVPITRPCFTACCGQLRLPASTHTATSST